MTTFPLYVPTPRGGAQVWRDSRRALSSSTASRRAVRKRPEPRVAPLAPPGGGAVGAKRYGTAEDARRYARAFDRRDTEDLAQRAPLVGLFPLRLLRAPRGRRRHR